MLLAVPAAAWAEGGAVGEFSFLSSLLQMVAALSIVIGLILVAWYIMNRIGGGFVAGRFPSRQIRIVETRQIAPKKALFLVEVGGEYLLLSGTEEGVQLIKQIEMLEEIEVVDDAERPGGLAAFVARLRGR